MPEPKIGAFVVPPRLVIMTLEGSVIVTIHMDGRVEVNPKFTVDSAARAFWDAVTRLNPTKDK